MANQNKTSMTITLNQEELYALLRILLDEDKEAAFHFLKVHLDKAVRAAVFGEGH
jgi:hypothetical protein